MDRVLRKNYPYWRVVYTRLNDALVKEGCDHTLKKTRQILVSLPGVDVGRSLGFMNSMGGYCDCAILLNVFSKERKPRNYFFNKEVKKKKKMSRADYVERKMWQQVWIDRHGSSQWY